MKPEARLQKQIHDYLTAVLPPCVFHWGTENKPRSAITAAHNKQRGVIAGAADLNILYQGKLYECELKTPTGQLMQSQKYFRDRINDAGGQYIVIRSLDELITALKQWNIPTRITEK